MSDTRAGIPRLLFTSHWHPQQAGVALEASLSFFPGTFILSLSQFLIIRLEMEVHAHLLLTVVDNDCPNA